MLFRDQKPLVSISIPTYNGAKYIEDTLNCAINQSYTNIEIIITDDQSTDNTLEICNAFAAKDKRIKVFQNKINLGLLGNWCEVVDKTSKESDWIKFLFQDDLMEPNTVLKMINAALTHNVDFVLTDRQYIFENGTTEVVKEAYAKMPQTGKIFKRSKKYSPEETASLIAKNDFFQNCLGEPPCILFKKSKYSHSDYPTEFLQTIDYLFILEKILKDNFYFVNEKLIQFRIHSSSQTNKNAKEESLYKRIVVHYYERIKLFHFLLNHPEVKSSYWKDKHLYNKQIPGLQNISQKPK